MGRIRAVVKPESPRTRRKRPESSPAVWALGADSAVGECLVHHYRPFRLQAALCPAPEIKILLNRSVLRAQVETGDDVTSDEIIVRNMPLCCRGNLERARRRQSRSVQ